MMRFAPFLLLAGLAFAATEPVYSPGFNTGLPYSPGLKGETFVYVSGQGAQDPKGQIPATVEAQVRQCLENVQGVLKAAGLTMDHVVLAQVYLTDMKNYDAMNRVYAEFFPKNPPARTTIGVVAMPLKTPVEISAVAVRDLKLKKTIAHPTRKMPVPVTPAVMAGDRVFITGGLGREESGTIPRDSKQQVKLSMEFAETLLRSAGMELRHLIAATIYVSPRMPMKLLAEAIDEYLPDETSKTVVQTAELPFGVNVQIAGIASRQIKRLGNCASTGDTAYCSGRAGTIGQVLETIKQELEANGLSMADVAAVNVFMDDIAEFGAMNKVYSTFFGKVKPTRTTVQPWKAVPDLSIPPTTGVKADDSPRVQIVVVTTR